MPRKSNEPRFSISGDAYVKHATLSDCGLYRYELSRSWLDGEGFVNFIMLNPSTADAEEDDPTIRRCVGFARRWGFQGIRVTNLFAFRATDPRALRTAVDPFGPEANVYLTTTARASERVVVAWGAHGSLLGRDRQVAELLREKLLLCLGCTKAGYPKHPLYLPSTSKLETWSVDRLVA